MQFLKPRITDFSFIGFGLCLMLTTEFLNKEVFAGSLMRRVLKQTMPLTKPSIVSNIFSNISVTPDSETNNLIYPSHK